jgi:hypothetical protein
VNQGAHLVRHGQTRYLSDHLIGSYRLAKVLGFTETECLACGLHSIAGTSTFKFGSSQAIELVRKEFSSEVAHLVWCFHVLDRRAPWPYGKEFRNRISGARLYFCEETLRSLRRIEVVNIFDQTVLRFPSSTHTAS